jgi:hypothetical protein
MHNARGLREGNKCRAVFITTPEILTASEIREMSTLHACIEKIKRYRLGRELKL